MRNHDEYKTIPFWLVLEVNLHTLRRDVFRSEDEASTLCVRTDTGRIQLDDVHSTHADAETMR
jgi:hypothetical protein